MSAPNESADPPGHVPPPVVLSGVTEIRVHGVGGATPEVLLADPAPQQVAGDRTAGFYRTRDRLGRHVEAYSWGGLTSRSSSRVLWLLLLPFMLANMAGWMAPARSEPEPGTTVRPQRPPRWLAALRDADAPTSFGYRWAARLAAVAVTGNVIVTACMISLDVLAYQCGAQTACATGRWWVWPLSWSTMDTHPGRRVLVGAAVPLAVLAMFAVLSVRSRRMYERVEPPSAVRQPPRPPPEVSAAGLAGGLTNPNFWAGKLSHARLTRLHLAAGVATTALIVTHCAAAATGGPAGGVAAVAFWFSWALGVAALLAVGLLLGVDVPWKWPSAVVLGLACCGMLAAAVCCVALPARPPMLGQLPGMRWAVNVAWIVTFALLVPLFLAPLAAAVVRSRRGLRRPRAGAVFRWGGPFVVTALGMIIANTVLLAVLVVVAQLLGTITWVITSKPLSYATADVDISLFPVVQVAVTLLVLGLVTLTIMLLAFGAAAYWAAGRGRRLTTLASALAAAYADDPQPGAYPPRDPRAWIQSAFSRPAWDPGGKPDTLGWARTVARWRFIARSTTRTSYAITGIVAVSVVVLVVVEILIWNADRPLSLLATGIGVTLAVLIPPALIALMFRSWKRVDRRRVIGTIWDVGTFFPRAFHPFAPPSYSERAVPELIRRIWWLHDNGGRVLLASHSQGTVLAGAALLRRSRRYDDGKEPAVALATFGSPLRKLYHWAFPACFSDHTLGLLTASRTGLGPGEWRNYYYDTDYIGGPVTLDGDVGPGGVDRLLKDPGVSDFIYGQGEPKVGSHTGYWTDPVMWAGVDRMEATLVAEAESNPVSPPDPQAPLPGTAPGR